jgi:large subunit ribosomal protein L19
MEKTATKSAVKVSPVNMKERQKLALRSGDTVRVWQKIEELKTGKGANKKAVTTRNVRKQAFEGLILAVKHGAEAGATFTVRRVASGVGVEKIFPLYSPNIDTIEILKRARVRRAKLYFIRRKAARDVKRQMRKSKIYVAPVGEAEVEEEVLITAPEAETAESAPETPAEEASAPEVVETTEEAAPEEAKETPAAAE